MTRHPLIDAAKGGYVEDINRILQNKETDINDTEELAGWNALMRAASNQHDRAVDCLLAAGADSDVQTTSGYTALMRSCEFGDENMIRRFLAAGANMEVQEKAGNTALHLASMYGHDGVVHLLLQNGARTDVVNNSRRTALDLAIANDYNLVEKRFKIFEAHRAEENSSAVPNAPPPLDNLEALGDKQKKYF